MKLLLVYAPFCTPTSPPYSLAKLKAFLEDYSDIDVEILDLNLRFHELKWKKWQKYFQNFTLDDYGEKVKEFLKITSKTYSENNWKVVDGKNPELFQELVKEIKNKKADYVAFSLVYSSQAFYTLALLKKLKNTIVGGPAVSQKLAKAAKFHLKNEVELLEMLGGKTNNLKCDNVLDFDSLERYFVKQPVIPIKTTSTCYYQKCTFCNHHQNETYREFDLKTIQETIKKSKQKQFFFIDDMISKSRLLQLAKILKPLKVKWMCQLSPFKSLDKKTLKILQESGLRVVIWGVESGSNRILKLMKKGTKVEDITQVLKDSKSVGIKNVVYVMFGFPTETKEELQTTIKFLRDNPDSIDLISTSVFGLQKGTFIYNNPEKFGIKKIIEEKRTVLDEKVMYDSKEIKIPKEVLKLNKYPKGMNFFREHLLNVSV